MSLPDLRRTHVILCTGGIGALGAAERATLARLLLERGLDVSCQKGAQEPGSPYIDGATLVVGNFAGVLPPPALGVQVVDAEGADLASLAATIEHGTAVRSDRPSAPWKPWFPVIDYSRCTNCMQCLSFCLFDVYGVSTDSKIQVQHQSNCKTDCPACSRVCPEVAIMFPKYRHGPINGDEVQADDVRREAMKVDISALLGGDIYTMLRDRSVKAKSRFSKERDDERALKERQNCLIAIQRDLDIPAEVLAALPSAEEILAKAEAARARTVVAGGAGGPDPKA